MGHIELIIGKTEFSVDLEFIYGSVYLYEHYKGFSLTIDRCPLLFQQILNKEPPLTQELLDEYKFYGISYDVEFLGKALLKKWYCTKFDDTDFWDSLSQDSRII